VPYQYVPDSERQHEAACEDELESVAVRRSLLQLPSARPSFPVHPMKL